MHVRCTSLVSSLSLASDIEVTGACALTRNYPCCTPARILCRVPRLHKEELGATALAVSASLPPNLTPYGTLAYLLNPLQSPRRDLGVSLAGTGRGRLPAREVASMGRKTRSRGAGGALGRSGASGNSGGSGGFNPPPPPPFQPSLGGFSSFAGSAVGVAGQSEGGCRHLVLPRAPLPPHPPPFTPSLSSRHHTRICMFHRDRH